MRKSFVAAAVCAAVLFLPACFVAPVSAQDAQPAVEATQEQVAAQREAFVKGYEQLVKNANEGLAKPIVTESFTKDGVSHTVQKFSIASVAVPATPNATTTTPCNIGVKVWFTLENGTCFNPIKRKMGVKEKFYVHVETAVPVYVSLFQNYPESRPESKQVYPDAKYPDSLKAMQPGQGTRLPVLFEMDDDVRDEIMSMVVVRADAPQIQSTLTTQATSSVSSTGGATTVTAQATATTAGTMKSINDRVAAGEAKENKFVIAGPAQTVTPSTAPADAAFYMFGAGYAGQWQLTLKK